MKFIVFTVSSYSILLFIMQLFDFVLEICVCTWIYKYICVQKKPEFIFVPYLNLRRGEKCQHCIPPRVNNRPRRSPFPRSIGFCLDCREIAVGKIHSIGARQEIYHLILSCQFLVDLLLAHGSNFCTISIQLFIVFSKPNFQLDIS